MEQKLTITEQIFGLVEKMTGFLDKFGIIKLFKTIFAVVVMYWLIVLAFNPSKIFEAYDRYQDRIHKEKVEKTLEAHYGIKNAVTELRYKTYAMRTIVMSLHNGTENINGNFQFLKVSALFEECGDYQSIMSEYNEVHITQYPIFHYLYDKEMFCGSVEDLKEIDSKMYYRLIANGVGYIHIQSLLGDKGEVIGFLVLTWDNDPANHELIHNRIYKSAMTISRLMN